MFCINCNGQAYDLIEPQFLAIRRFLKTLDIAIQTKEIRKELLETLLKSF
jgi:hypothetical protein